MKKFVVSLLFTAFCVSLIYVGSHRLYDWYETGQLAMHRKMLFSPDYVLYNSDPVLFVAEFTLNLFFVVMGFLGIGSACQDLSQ
jgi:hypothetical protein